MTPTKKTVVAVAVAVMAEVVMGVEDQMMQEQEMVMLTARHLCAFGNHTGVRGCDMF